MEKGQWGNVFHSKGNHSGRTSSKGNIQEKGEAGDRLLGERKRGVWGGVSLLRRPTVEGESPNE